LEFYIFVEHENFSANNFIFLTDITKTIRTTLVFSYEYLSVMNLYQKLDRGLLDMTL